MTHRLLPLVLLAALAASGTASAQTMVRDTLDIELNVRTHYTSYVDSAGNTVVGCSNVIIGVHPDPLGNGRDGDYRYHSIVNGTIPTNYYYAHDVLDQYGDPGDIPGERISYTAAQNSAATCANSNATQGLQEFAARLRSYATYSIPEGPLALFEWEQTDGLTVRFDGTASRVVTAQGRRPVSSHSWSYGTPSTTAVTEHTFQQPGDYDVTLTVTDSNGNEDSQTRTVTVTGHQLTVKAVPLEPGRHYALADTLVIETTVTNTGGSSVLDVTVPPHTETPYDAPPRPSDSVVLRPLLERLGTREPEMRAVLGVGESIVTRDSFRVDGYAGYVIRSPRETVHQEIRLWGEMPGRIEASSGTEEPVLIRRPCKGGACETVTVGPPEAAFSAQARVEQTEGTQGETLLFIGTVENTGGVPLRTLSASADFDIEVVFPDSVEGRPQTEPVFRAVPEAKAPVTRAEFAPGDTVEVRRSYVIEDVATYQDADGETREVEVQIIVTMGEVTAETEDGDPVAPDRSCAVPPSGSQALARRVPPECGRNTADVIPLSSGLVVNSVEDGGDEEPGDGVCDTGERLTIEGVEVRECTLRAAIEEANEQEGVTIAFDIEGEGIQTIPLRSALPPIEVPVVLDATTQPSYDETPVIFLDGSGAGVNSSGLRIVGVGDGVSIGAVVRGLAVGNFGWYGVWISGGGNNRIENNHIGTDAAGALARGNGRAGVYLSNEARGTALDANVISGNDSLGVHLQDGLFTRIVNNRIGTNATGTAALANGGAGIRHESGSVDIGEEDAGNLISGNAGPGIFLERSNGEVHHNRIGTNAAGTAALPNGGGGIDVMNDSPDIQDNLISGNEGFGVRILQTDNGSSSVEPQFTSNLIGTDVLGAAALPNRGPGVHLRIEAARPVTVGDDGRRGILGAAETPANVISGNAGPGVWVEVLCEPERCAERNEPVVVGGNFIGTDRTGTQAVGNAGPGVLIDNGNRNVTVKANLISGNATGVLVQGATSAGVAIEDNTVGADVRRQAPLGNLGDGIRLVLSGADFGTAPFTVGVQVFANTVVANQGNGVAVVGASSSSLCTGCIDVSLKGNRIGVSALSGAPHAVAMGNMGAGVYLDDGASYNEVGSRYTGSGPSGYFILNVIAHNAGQGIVVEDGVRNDLQGNYIFGNGRQPIDLADDGTTENDSNDADDGPNERQNYPEITEAYLAAGELFLKGALRSEQLGRYFVDLVVDGLDLDGYGRAQGFLTHLNLESPLLPDEFGDFPADISTRMAARALVPFFDYDEPAFAVPLTPGILVGGLATDRGFLSALEYRTGNSSEFTPRPIAILLAPTTDQSAAAGEDRLSISEGSGSSERRSAGNGYAEGDEILICPSCETEERATVTGVDAGTILLASPLERAHAAGEAVVPFARSIATALVVSDTLIAFGGGTAVGARFVDVTGGGPVEVERFRRAPSVLEGVAEPRVIPHRWVVSLDSTLAFGTESEMQFRLVEIPNLAAERPEAFVVYRRPAPGEGTFTALPTRFDSTGVVVASMGSTALGEFVLATTEVGLGTPAEEGPGEAAVPPALAVSVFPNPSSSRSTIRLALPEPGPVRLSVLDALGREVAVLEDGVRSAGDLEVALDTGRLTPGVYVVVLEAGGTVATRTLTVVR